VAIDTRLGAGADTEAPTFLLEEMRGQFTIYDFFLNAGGPGTPISTAILRLSHLEHANVLLVVLWPLCVLLGVGAVVGFLVSRLKV